MTTIGQLKERITIQSRVETVDSSGEPIVTWPDYAVNIAAKVERLSGREFEGMSKVNSQATDSVTVRIRRDIGKTMRMAWRDRVSLIVSYWNIHDVAPIQREPGYMALLVSRVE